MAWTKVKEQGHLAESETTVEGKTAKRVFIAISDTPTTTVAAETANDGATTIPLPYSVHPNDSTRAVKSVSATPDEESNRTVFRVEVEYASGSISLIPNPLDRPDDISFDGSVEKTAFLKSEDDPPKTIATSAGELFEDFQERDTGVFRLVIEGNRASIDLALYASYLYPATAENSIAVTVRGLTIGAGEGRMVGISASTPQTENGVTFIRVRWEVAVAPNWDLKILDRGFNELNNSVISGGLLPIMKPGTGIQVDTPWPLDGSGGKKANPTDEPAELTFKRYPQKSFAVFGWTVAA